jgi:DNA-binding transcriptional LysR family regulator
MRRRELEMRDLRNFLAVAETLHFGRAASQLGIAQPVLSQQIKRMEAMIGHTLLERTPRGVTLTPVGAYFQRRAEVLRANLQDAIRTARRIGGGEDGSLIVGVCGSVMLTRFSEVVKRFRTSHSQVDLQLRELDAEQHIEQLLDGTVDISILRDGQPTEGLLMQTLYCEPLIAILPEGHPLAGKRKLQLAKLKEERFVIFSPAMARIVGVCFAAGFRPNIVQEALQWATVVSLVGSGMGVSIAPACVSRLSVAGTTYRPLQSEGRSTIDVVTRTELKNPAAKTLLGMVQEEFGKRTGAYRRALGPSQACV